MAKTSNTKAAPDIEALQDRAVRLVRAYDDLTALGIGKATDEIYDETIQAAFAFVRATANQTSK